MKFVHSDRYLQLGLKIAYYRKLKGLTQEQLAEMVDLNTSTIGQIEAPNIVRAVSMDTLFDIADALEIPPYKLIMFEE